MIVTAQAAPPVQESAEQYCREIHLPGQAIENVWDGNGTPRQMGEQVQRIEVRKQAVERHLASLEEIDSSAGAQEPWPSRTATTANSPERRIRLVRISNPTAGTIGDQLRLRRRPA